MFKACYWLSVNLVPARKVHGYTGALYVNACVHDLHKNSVYMYMYTYTYVQCIHDCVCIRMYTYVYSVYMCIHCIYDIAEHECRSGVYI